MRVDDYQGDAAEWGLRCYVAAIAVGLGLASEDCCCELARPANAYLALNQRAASFPDRNVALLWDEVHGWSAGIETASGEDIIVLAYLGDDLLPVPEQVVAFAHDIVSGQRPGQLEPPTPTNKDMTTRLRRYAHHS